MKEARIRRSVIEFVELGLRRGSGSSDTNEQKKDPALKSASSSIALSSFSSEV